MTHYGGGVQRTIGIEFQTAAMHVILYTVTDIFHLEQVVRQGLRNPTRSSTTQPKFLQNGNLRGEPEQSHPRRNVAVTRAMLNTVYVHD